MIVKLLQVITLCLYILILKAEFNAAATAEQCEAGWTLLNRKCYWKSSHGTNWHDAKNICMEKNGSLAEPTTSIEQADIKNLIRTEVTIDGYQYWFGGHRLVGSTWVWDSTNATLTDTDWYSSEPNGLENNEFCIEIGFIKKLKWFDDLCTQIFYFLCEKPIESFYTEHATDEITSHIARSTPALSCPCVCDGSTTWIGQNYTREELLVMLAPALEKTRHELRVNKSNLSSYKRRKTSAADSRTSATAIGWIGSMCICTVIAIIVLFDVLSLVKRVILSRESNETVNTLIAI